GPDRAALHGRRPAGARGTVHRGAPARVLRRDRLSRPRADAHAQPPLDRSGADAARAPPEPDPPWSPALQHLRFAHRGVRDRDGRADDERGALRYPAALARARLHPAGAEGSARSGRAADAGEPVVPRGSGAIRVRAHAARVATPRWTHGLVRAAPVSTAAGVWDELPDREAGDRRAALGPGAAGGERVHAAAGHDEIDASGLIPVSLVRWELTGESGGVPGVGWPAKRP